VLPVGYSYDIITLLITLKKLIKNTFKKHSTTLAQRITTWALLRFIGIIASRIHTNKKSITGLKVEKTTS